MLGASTLTLFTHGSRPWGSAVLVSRPCAAERPWGSSCACLPAPHGLDPWEREVRGYRRGLS